MTCFPKTFSTHYCSLVEELLQLITHTLKPEREPWGESNKFSISSWLKRVFHVHFKKTIQFLQFNLSAFSLLIPFYSLSIFLIYTRNPLEIYDRNKFYFVLKLLSHDFQELKKEKSHLIWVQKKSRRTWKTTVKFLLYIFSHWIRV